jgi:hypothetical protein
MLFGGICTLLGAVIWLAGMAFWIWMIVDCVTNEPGVGNDKLIWVLIIVFLPLLGSLIYYFVRRPERIRTHGK